MLALGSGQMLLYSLRKSDLSVCRTNSTGGACRSLARVYVALGKPAKAHVFANG